MSALAEGRAESFGIPPDFMERVRQHEHSVGLGTGWYAMSEALREHSGFIPADGSDYLYLDEEREDDAIESIRALADHDEEDIRNGVPDAVEAIEAMRAERVALGMDSAQWALG